MNADGEAFGEDRLREVCVLYFDEDINIAMDHTPDDFAAWKGSRSFIDVVTLLAIVYL